jgi:hypothetical protein
MSTETEETIWYPNRDDFCVDDACIQKIGQVMLDENAILQPLDRRKPRPNYDDWTEGDALAYLEFVNALVSEAGQEGPPKTWQIDRASRIGLGGPSKQALMRLLGESTIAGLQKRAGEYRTRSDFAHWDKIQYLRVGKGLADHSQKRPREQDIEAWHASGMFPSVAQMKHRFGTIGAWQEGIGYPSPVGWTQEDYAMWGGALYLANPDLRVTDKVLNFLSQHGRGPSAHAVNKHMGGIPKFRDAGYEKFEELKEAADLQRTALFQEAIEHAQKGVLPYGASKVTQAFESEDFARNYAKFALLRRLTPGLDAQDDFSQAMSLSDTELIQLIVARNKNISASSVISAARAYRLESLLWPSHRFANVDFSIPERLYNPKIGVPKTKAA